MSAMLSPLQSLEEISTLPSGLTTAGQLMKLTFPLEVHPEQWVFCAALGFQDEYPNFISWGSYTYLKVDQTVMTKIFY